MVKKIVILALLLIISFATVFANSGKGETARPPAANGVYPPPPRSK